SNVLHFGTAVGGAVHGLFFPDSGQLDPAYNGGRPAGAQFVLPEALGRVVGLGLVPLKLLGIVKVRSSYLNLDEGWGMNLLDRLGGSLDLAGMFHVLGHGDPYGVYDGQNALTAHQLADRIRSNPGYHKGMSVVLEACHVGQGTFPQELSNLLGVPVYATPD